MQLQTCIIHTAYTQYGTCNMQHAKQAITTCNCLHATCTYQDSSAQLPGGNANHLGIVRERQDQLVSARRSPEDKTVNVGNPRCIGETICLPFQIGTRIWLEGRDIHYSYRYPDLTCASIRNAIFTILLYLWALQRHLRTQEPCSFQLTHLLYLHTPWCRLQTHMPCKAR